MSRPAVFLQPPRDRDRLKPAQAPGEARPRADRWRKVLRALDPRRLRKTNRPAAPGDDEPLGYC